MLKDRVASARLLENRTLGAKDIAAISVVDVGLCGVYRAGAIGVDGDGRQRYSYDRATTGAGCSEYSELGGNWSVLFELSGS